MPVAACVTRMRRVVALTMAVGGLSACTTDHRDPTTDARASTGAGMPQLSGAGATFPYPLYAQWFNQYAETASVRIRYQSVGSGEGIRALLAGDVDFGASDRPLTAAELAQAREPIVQIPTVLGAVAITYNVPQVRRPLQFDAASLAALFSGEIRRWNDPRLATINPGVELPAIPVVVVTRTDGGGTATIFREYLSRVSPDWAPGGRWGGRAQWPVGVSSHGNEGVAGQVKQTVGAIGFLEVVYARQNHLPVAHIRNRAGRFISPMPFEIAFAAAQFADRPEAPTAPHSLLDAPGAQSYPIAAYTWMLLTPRRTGHETTRQLQAFLHWALTDGSDIASAAGYAPLPTVMAMRVLQRLDSVVLRSSGPGH